MKMYALFVILAVALAGCSTTYKGSVKGAFNQEESKSGKYIATHSLVVSPDWSR
jgi:hypothetical protein